MPTAHFDSRGSRTTDCRWRLLALALLMVLPIGCLGLSRKTAVRGNSNTAIPLPHTEANEPPPEIKPPPPPVPGQTTGMVNSSVETPSAALKRLALGAVEREKQLNSYIVRIRRRETVNGQDQPEEIMLLKFRREPQSLHIKWLGAEAKGREIVYVKDRNDDKIQLLTGVGDLFGPGKKMSFPIDSSVLRSKSRYSITEAGLGAVCTRFAALMNAIERGQPNAGSARYLGLQARPEFPEPIETVEQTIPPGLESTLPRGGTRFFYFEPKLGVPTAVVTLDDNKHQVEYYHFDRLQSPVNLDDADFDPAVLWKK